MYLLYLNNKINYNIRYQKKIILLLSYLVNLWYEIFLRDLISSIVHFYYASADCLNKLNMKY